MDLVEAAYRHSLALPSAEPFGLSSQMRRAAVFIPANIAESYGRDSSGSYAQFLKTARGSLLEFETHVLVAERVNLLPASLTRPVPREVEATSKMLSGLIKSIEGKGCLPPIA